MAAMAKGVLLAVSAGLHCDALHVSNEQPFKVLHESQFEKQESPEPLDGSYIKALGNIDAVTTHHNSLTYKSFAWIASEFEDCIKSSCSASSGWVQLRKVKCVNIFSGEESATSQECISSGMKKPSEGRICDCLTDTVDCHKKKKAADATTTGDLAVPTDTSGNEMCHAVVFEDDDEQDWSSYGIDDTLPCYKWTATEKDEKMHPKFADRPLRCEGWPHFGTPCDGGLSFHAKELDMPEEEKPKACVDFCVKQGWNVGGIEYGKTCRCGGTKANLKPWGTHMIRPELQFRPEVLGLSKTKATCPLKVYLYNGPFTDQGIPQKLQDDNVEIEAYRQRIMMDATILPSDEEGHELKYPPLDVSPAEVVTPWSRTCYPGKCGAGDPWEKRVNCMNTDEDFCKSKTMFEEYTVLPFKMDDSRLTQEKKDLLQAAMHQISKDTCIIFEDDDDPLEQHIAVTMGYTESDYHRCYVQGMGKPPGTSNAYFNMGSCDNEGHVGNVIHELMKVLGMNEPQHRPDALFSYQGKGPWIWNVSYFVVATQLRFNQDPKFFAPLEDAYMGGNGVFAPLDYESIMMPGNTNGFMYSVPASVQDLVGQRHGLSKGDVEMINTVYSCKPKAEAKAKMVVRAQTESDMAIEQEVRLTSAQHMAQNIKDLEVADKWAPEVAKQARALLAKMSKPSE